MMNERRGRPKGERRSEILDYAATLFANEGVAKGSMADIGKAVGMHKASLYYFFDSKEALLREVLRPVVEQPVHDLRRIVEGPGDVIHRFVEGLAALGRAYQEHPHRMQILVREQLERHLSSEAHDEVRRLKAAYTDLWRQLLREGVESGVLEPLDDKITAFGLIGSVNWMYAWFDPDGELSGEDIARLYARQYLAGLAKGPAARARVRAAATGIGVAAAESARHPSR